MWAKACAVVTLGFALFTAGNGYLAYRAWCNNSGDSRIAMSFRLEEEAEEVRDLVTPSDYKGPVKLNEFLYHSIHDQAFELASLHKKAQREGMLELGIDKAARNLVELVENNGSYSSQYIDDMLYDTASWLEYNSKIVMTENERDILYRFEKGMKRTAIGLVGLLISGGLAGYFWQKEQ